MDKENKSAREMWQELGYKFNENDKYIYCEDYENEDLRVVFDKQHKTVDCNATYDYSFDMQFFKVIQKQIEELGWE